MGWALTGVGCVKSLKSNRKAQPPEQRGLIRVLVVDKCLRQAVVNPALRPTTALAALLRITRFIDTTQSRALCRLLA